MIKQQEQQLQKLQTTKLQKIKTHALKIAANDRQRRRQSGIVEIYASAFGRKHAFLKPITRGAKFKRRQTLETQIEHVRLMQERGCVVTNLTGGFSIYGS